MELNPKLIELLEWFEKHSVIRAGFADWPKPLACSVVLAKFQDKQLIADAISWFYLVHLPPHSASGEWTLHLGRPGKEALLEHRNRGRMAAGDEAGASDWYPVSWYTDQTGGGLKAATLRKAGERGKLNRRRMKKGSHWEYRLSEVLHQYPEYREHLT